MIPVRQMTLKKLMKLHDYANKKKGKNLSVDEVMKILNISRRTAYDYLMTYQYITLRL